MAFLDTTGLTYFWGKIKNNMARVFTSSNAPSSTNQPKPGDLYVHDGVIDVFLSGIIGMTGGSAPQWNRISNNTVIMVNAVCPSSATDPENPSVGDCYYSTTRAMLCRYNGTTWVSAVPNYLLSFLCTTDNMWYNLGNVEEPPDGAIFIAEDTSLVYCYYNNAVHQVTNINDLPTDLSLTDADFISYYSAAKETPRKISWARIKANLKTYFDGIYVTSESMNNYSPSVTTATALPTSGTALTDNRIYTIPSTSPVGTYQFVAPATGQAHGTFYTDTTFAITFATGAKYIGGVPSFAASTQYEFDVLDGVWAIQEVTS